MFFGAENRRRGDEAKRCWPQRETKRCALSPAEEHLHRNVAVSAGGSSPEDEQALDRTFSLYLDATEGFGHIAKLTQSIFHPSYEPTSRDQPEGSTSPGHLIYAPGNLKDDRQNNDRSGFPGGSLKTPPTFNLQLSMCIVMAYQYWEDYFRARIAAAYGIPKNELTIPVFGDLRFIRRSVIHYRCLKRSKTKSDFVHLKPGSHGDDLDFDRGDTNGIWFFVKQALRDLKTHGPAYFKDLARRCNNRPLSAGTRLFVCWTMAFKEVRSSKPSGGPIFRKASFAPNRSLRFITLSLKQRTEGRSR